MTQIARAADGSVRDGLSLLDQAIAQADPARDQRTRRSREMLGLADRAAVFDLFERSWPANPRRRSAITDGAHERGADSA